MRHWEFPFRILCFSLLILSCAITGFAGVSRTIQDQYRKQYENKAMFLKIPIYAEKQMIFITGQNFRIDRGTGILRYKVGDQLRVLLVDFGSDEIKLRLGGIGKAGYVDLGYKFEGNLQESFPNRDVFDRALQATLTEGLKYTDIDQAKETFVQDQFERAVKEIAGSASINRDSVLETIAPQIPAFQDAQRDIQNLRSRMQSTTEQLTQSLAQNRQLESDVRAQQTEMARLKRENAAIQEKLDTYTMQVSRLGDEVRDAKGSAQGYQKELANIQRSLNLRVDSGRDLTAQLTDLGQAMKKMQKDNDSLTNQNSSLRTNLQGQQATNARLLADNEEIKAANQKLKATLSDVTSQGDSLGKRYLDLKTEKEKLDDLNQAVKSIRTRIVEESVEDGTHFGKAGVYLKTVPIGMLQWSIPSHLSQGKTQTGEASFTAESIDYVRVSPEERHLLRSLGGKYKLRFQLTPSSDSIIVTPDQNEPVREIGERDHSTWKWSIQNNGAQDGRLVLTAAAINRDSNEIALLQYEPPVVASNVVRQVRGYLQPVPLICGAVIGFLLFGIVGIFRKPKSRAARPKAPSNPPSETTTYIGKKQL